MFDKQYVSDFHAKNDALKPLLVKTSLHRALDIIADYAKKNEYEEVTTNKDYFEVFGVRNDFEITFILVNNQDGSIVIKVLAYTENTFGGTKRMIKQINSELKELFKNYQ